MRDSYGNQGMNIGGFRVFASIGKVEIPPWYWDAAWRHYLCRQAIVGRRPVLCRDRVTREKDETMLEVGKYKELGFIEIWCDSLSERGSELRGAWRHGVLRQAVTRKQWVWEDAGAWRFMDGVTCDDMNGEVHIKLLSRGDTSGEVRRAGLRVGRFVEAGPRAGSSPFLFVCGDDRVIRYTGADVDTGGAEDAQMAE
ncbi:hypothetical protein DEO72_LG8g1910 [Vigna unguiculata]|uniref:Uncharacterized protein n=1 Tax=Vigna unguiculata TaxID=3917 RepID=A0A4D6MTC9_VIGUN|nr:hypothetical protein DEO72_LG8g1910 [Vigna unguiculata]